MSEETSLQERLDSGQNTIPKNTKTLVNSFEATAKEIRDQLKGKNNKIAITILSGIKDFNDDMIITTTVEAMKEALTPTSD